MQLHTPHDLSHHNTMALSSVADVAITLTDVADIMPALAHAKEHGLSPFVLSGGSNVLLPSRLHACVLLPRFLGVRVLDEDDSSISIEVAGGENWHAFVKTCLDKGWYGLENLALIPGLVGASPIQNIGAYGVQVSDFITQVIAYDLKTGDRIEFDNASCQFAYRDSFFKQQPNRYLIGHVVFKLYKHTDRVVINYGDLAHTAQTFAKTHERQDPHPLDVFDAVVAIRQSKLPDPDVLANCGSFFQNPVIPMEQFLALKAQFADLPSYPIDKNTIKIPAGWLIDKAGLKGKGIYPILTHEKQALVLTNHARQHATQDDILLAQNFIIDRIRAEFGVLLVREPVWVDKCGLYV